MGKLIVEHLLGKPIFSGKNNIRFIQFHKTKELQRFLPNGLLSKGGWGIAKKSLETVCFLVGDDDAG